MTSLLDPSDPVIRAYLIASLVLALKLALQGWITVAAMMRVKGGWASPEDLRPGLINPAPDAAQLEPSPQVERARRMHRNDLENIPAFWAAGLGFALSAPPLWLAQVVFYGYLGARGLHFLAYGRAMSHEVRATAWSIGSLMVIYMACHALAVLVLPAG